MNNNIITTIKRATFDATRYGLDEVNTDSDINAGLFFSSLIMDGIASLCLGLSLNHQYKHRSPRDSKDSLSKILSFLLSFFLFVYSFTFYLLL